MAFNHLFFYCVTHNCVRIQCNAPAVWLLHCIRHTVSELSECLQRSHRDMVHTAHGILGAQRTPDDRPMQTLRTGSKSSAVCVGKREGNTQKD